MAMIKKYVAKAIQRTRHLSSFLEQFFTNPIAADFFSFFDSLSRTGQTYYQQIDESYLKN